MISPADLLKACELLPNVKDNKSSVDSISLRLHQFKGGLKVVQIISSEDGNNQDSIVNDILKVIRQKNSIDPSQTTSYAHITAVQLATQKNVGIILAQEWLTVISQLYELYEFNVYCFHIW